MEWWTELPAPLRYAAALALIAVGVLWFLFGTSRLFRGPAFCVALGLALLFFAGPSDSEKKGYNF